MSEFVLGIIVGAVSTLVITPFIVKWYIKKKISDMTGGLF